MLRNYLQKDEFKNQTGSYWLDEIKNRKIKRSKNEN